MNTDTSDSKKFFEQAYHTGTDTWTDHSYTEEVLSFARLLPHKSIVLDLGSGRGEWAFLFADIGLRVIGIDFVESLALQNNEKVVDRGYAGQVAFRTGSVFDIPLQNESVDAVSDIGTLHHIHPNEWPAYVEEVYRVVKPRGFVLLVQLSRNTTNFFGTNPSKEITRTIEKFGLVYHFFDTKEVQDMFGPRFSLIKHETHSFPDIHDYHYVFCLLQKK